MRGGTRCSWPDCDRLGVRDFGVTEEEGDDFRCLEHQRRSPKGRVASGVPEERPKFVRGICTECGHRHGADEECKDPFDGLGSHDGLMRSAADRRSSMRRVK